MGITDSSTEVVKQPIIKQPKLKRTPGSQSEPGVPTVLEIIAQAARDPGVDPAKLTALLELKERIDAKAAQQEFTAAFSRLLNKMPRVKKDGMITLRTKEGVDKGTLPFARWEDIDTVIRPLLAEENFTLNFTCEPLKDVVMMTGHLRHSSGHAEKSTMQLPPDPGPGRNALQAIGSSHSYGKRYITLDLLNIVSMRQDDDGQGIGNINDEQSMRIYDLLQDLGVSKDKKRVEKFLSFAGAESVETIQRYRYEEIVRRLRRDLAKRQQQEAEAAAQEAKK